MGFQGLSDLQEENREKESTKFDELEKRFNGIIDGITECDSVIRNRLDALFYNSNEIKGVSGTQGASPSPNCTIDKFNTIAGKLEGLLDNLRDSSKLLTKIV